MKSQTSLVAQQTRLNEWAQQIRECQNRPDGMKVEEWCFQHGITKATYYWRLRKVREALLEVASVPHEFVELKPVVPTALETVPKSNVIAVLKGTNGLALEITDQASPAFIKSMLGAMINAQ